MKKCVCAYVDTQIHARARVYESADITSILSVLLPGRSESERHAAVTRLGS